MKTPIYDFLVKYCEADVARMHMPGHKGASRLGFEKYDVTEIFGADSLYDAEGIIQESEKAAGELFGAHTFYSAEGSSLAIRAMLYLALTRCEKGQSPAVIAGRNAHKTFVSAAALLDFDVCWIDSHGETSYLCCPITPSDVERTIIDNESAVAVYITSPDYLGNTVDVEGIAQVCHRHGVLLLVDNAHGAYLKFLDGKKHPMDLGADMCADSAHKTLPVITGGAYLHISKNAPEELVPRAKEALALFGSTSPSYLILASLDLANRYIADGYREKLRIFARRVAESRSRLSSFGFSVIDGENTEPLKITVMPKEYGYSGFELADILRENGVECEFCDPDFLVLMLTPENTESDILRLEDIMGRVKKREPIKVSPPPRFKTECVLRIREAVMCPAESLPVEECIGRVLASVTVGCPPAVPILVSGERVDELARSAFEYYNIKQLKVVK